MQNKNPLSIFGPDLNEFSRDVNFVTLDKNSDFIYLRASGSGTGKLRIDKKFLEFAKACRKLDIPCGAYHFAKPSKDLDSAAMQADQFIDVLQQGFGTGDYGDLFPVLDVETPTDRSLTTTELVNWVDRFRDRFEEKTRRRLMLYTGLFFIDLYDDFKVPGKGYPLSDMPLWIAMYTRIPSNPKVPPNIGGWKRWTMWQFTDEGKLDGVGSPVDLNWGPNSIDSLMPPSAVTGLNAYISDNKIYVNWTANKEDDLNGYNVFVNDNYAGTLPRKATKIVIDKSRFYLPKGKAIIISIEAFDITGDFSKERTEYILDNDG
ncbi:glycoside hydrolase family 25 protein [Clostridium sp.]|uniref:glycoside hydrolase family 25 protein n=1 Tax=Clostridium sp. TaxID=1506 RepID=UPI002615677F